MTQPAPIERITLTKKWDGSIGKHGKNSFHARFFSGSKIFIEGMLAELEKSEFPPRRIYSRMRYERKYLIFRKAFEENNADQLKLDLYHTIENKPKT